MHADHRRVAVERRAQPRRLEACVDVGLQLRVGAHDPREHRRRPAEPAERPVRLRHQRIVALVAELDLDLEDLPAHRRVGLGPLLDLVDPRGEDHALDALVGLDRAHVQVQRHVRPPRALRVARRVALWRERLEEARPVTRGARRAVDPHAHRRREERSLGGHRAHRRLQHRVHQRQPPRVERLHLQQLAGVRAVLPLHDRSNPLLEIVRRAPGDVLRRGVAPRRRVVPRRHLLEAEDVLRRVAAV
eukprot:7225330-Prymnesium_polylepis.1